MAPETRLLLINIRSLLLKAVDMIERACELGKYAKPKAVTINPGDSIAGVVTVAVTTTSEMVNDGV